MSICFHSGLHFAGSREDRNMKTLLLTLVVVTIVCLDVGYTIKCFRDFGTPEPCPDGQNLCYVKTWCNVYRGSKRRRIERGCVASCPEEKPEESITCCSTDNCNPHPKEKDPCALLSSTTDHP